MESEDGRRARGEKTRDAILDAAVQIASQEGLEGLSIGRLATELGVSKSGLFAHFGSKTELQIATVDAAREIFLERGDRRQPRVAPGSAVLLGLTDSWLDYMEVRRFPAAGASSPPPRSSSTVAPARCATGWRR